MTRRLSLFALPILVIALTIAGCKHTGTTNPPIHANAANAFDSSTYDILVSAQAAIEQAKIGIPASKKPLLNQAIADYNIAERLYRAYHTAAVAGTATPAQQAALQTQVNSLAGSLGGLK